MAENRVSASLAPADKEAVMQAIATIKEKLPLLIYLTPEDHVLPFLRFKSKTF